MQYDFNVPANGGQVIDVAGKFFKYKSGTGAIRVTTNKGGYVDLLPGQGVWNTDFTTLTIKDRSGANNAGVLLAGAFDFHDDRISGTVDVVDGGKSRTLGGISFIGYTGLAPAAGNYSHVQLLNPVGSNKKVIVEQVVVGSGSACGIALRQYDTPLTTLLGVGTSKLIGGTASTTELRVQANAAILGVNTLYSLDISANNPFPFKLNEPIILMPGRGIVFFSGVVNTSLTGNYEWYEEAL